MDAPALVRDLAVRCRDRGGRAFLVGGCVRDHLRGVPVTDWDVEVFGIPEPALEELLRGLGRVDAVGRSFGVFKLQRGRRVVDVSLPRRDSNAGPGHRGIRVEGDPWLSPSEAARRRDLTINAILLDVLTGEILDPWGGRQDLADGRLRAVDRDTFLEDPLRALRAVQFAARLEAEPDAELVALCREAALDELPPERIRGEWQKLLLQGRVPSRGLALARASDALGRLFPEAAAHDHPDVDRALDRLAAEGGDATAPEGRRFAVGLATWLHRADAAAVEATLDRLWLHTWKGYPLRDRTRAAVAHWREEPATDAALRHLSTRTELEVTCRVQWAVTGRPEPLERLERARALGVLHAPPAPILLGRHLADLGVAPGPAMGAVLRHVYALQLDGVVTDLDQARAAALAWRG